MGDFKLTSNVNWIKTYYDRITGCSIEKINFDSTSSKDDCHHIFMSVNRNGNSTWLEGINNDEYKRYHNNLREGVGIDFNGEGYAKHKFKHKSILYRFFREILSLKNI